jgi:glycosyltransferase involved in cell wall biosynthesis
VKILLCHNYYQQPGGESEVFENEARGLAQMGEDVIVYARRNTDLADMSTLQKIGVVISAYSSRQTLQEVMHLVAKEKPEVALVQNVFPLLTPSLYVALAEAGVPIIQAVYNYRFICPSAELYTEGEICERCVPGNTGHAVVHRCYRGSYFESAWYASIIGIHRALGTFSHKINSFMVPDKFLGAKLTEGGIPASKIWYNPNPVFLQEYQARPIHQGYILFVGRLVAQKGILTLLKAMESTHEPSKLVIVGQGELLDEVRGRISQGGLSQRVTLLGPVWGAELNELIAQSAAVIIPSEWYDNLPMMLCKANALGKPVIASRINGIPEYITHGETGYLFEPGNAVELANLINKVLSLSPSEYRQFSESARAFAEDVLDYTNHYRNLIEKIQILRNRASNVD